MLSLTELFSTSFFSLLYPLYLSLSVCYVNE
jgi:hypothetical protein